MEITHLLSLWLKYPFNWTRNSVSAWCREWLPPFTVSYGCLKVAVFMELTWHKPYTPHCFLLSCRMEEVYVGGCSLACVWVHMPVCSCLGVGERDKEERTEIERIFPWVKELLNCHFPHCLLFKIIFYCYRWLSFFVAVIELQGKYWQFWQDYEARRISWGKYSHVLCRAFSFCFLHKRSQLNQLWSSYKHCYLKKDTQWRLSTEKWWSASICWVFTMGDVLSRCVHHSSE